MGAVSAFLAGLEARRRRRGTAVVTGGKSEEIQADQTRAGRLEDSEFQALCCCTEEQPHTRVSGEKITANLQKVLASC